MSLRGVEFHIVCAWGGAQVRVFRGHCVIGEKTVAERTSMREREVVRRSVKLKLCWLRRCMYGSGTVQDGCYALVAHCEGWMEHPLLQSG